LSWVQNSVFEGEVTEATNAKIVSGIKDIINTKVDSIVYYTFDSKNYTERTVYGIEKSEIDSFV
jgi:CRISPR-associated protein Cas2